MDLERKVDHKRWNANSKNVVTWLELGDADMPQFLAMYFEQPDSACHTEGPDSDLVKSGLIYVDAMINYLMYRLDRKGLLGCLNIVIVSDHGGQALHREKFVSADHYVNVSDPNMALFPGVVGHINFHNLTSVNVTEVIEPFQCNTNHSFRVYTKRTIPKRYHYTNTNRIGPVIFDGYPGSRMFRSQSELETFTDKGDHGYDNRNREMRAIFGAYGPDIHQKKLIPPFQNIELYNFFTDLMRLPVTAPNNGTKGLLHSVMKNPPEHVDNEAVELQTCENVELINCGDECYSKLTLLNESSTKPRGECERLKSLEAPQALVTEMDACVVDFCNASMVYSRRLGAPLFVESVLTLPVPNIDHRANCSAMLYFYTKESTASSMVASSLWPNKTKLAQNFDVSRNLTTEDLQYLEKVFSDDVNVNGYDDTGYGRLRRQSDPIAKKKKLIRKQYPKFASVNAEMINSTDANKLCESIKWNTTKWISLFPDNDYTRFILQGQIRVPSWFYNGPWKRLLELIVKYQRHYKKLLMFSGPIFDYNDDGLADSVPKTFTFGTPQQPSHIFVILMRCTNAKWRDDYRACEPNANTSTLALVLPLIVSDDNCLFLEEYLFMHTVRIRDIELMTNLEWFTNRKVYTAEQAIRLRTSIEEQLWQLEVESESSPQPEAAVLRLKP